MQKNNLKHFFHLHFLVLIAGFTAILGELITNSSEVIVWHRMIIGSVLLGLYMLASNRSFSIDFKLFYQHLNKISQGSNVDTPTYCYKTHLRKKKTYRINKPDVLLVNGLFILLNKKIRDFFDLTIFLDIDSDTRLKRRITRDIRERGGERNLIKNKYKNVIKPMHEKYVEPNKKFANLILDNNTNYKSIYQEIEIKLNKIDKKNKKI